MRQTSGAEDKSLVIERLRVSKILLRCRIKCLKAANALKLGKLPLECDAIFRMTADQLIDDSADDLVREHSQVTVCALMCREYAKEFESRDPNLGRLIADAAAACRKLAKLLQERILTI